MTWPGLAALSAAALALTVPAPGLAAVRGKAVSSALAASGPAYAPGSRLCAAGTHNFRVFWDETRGSRHLPTGRSARDQNCSTAPPLVRRIVAIVERMRSAEIALGFKPPASDAGTRRNGGDGRYDIYLARQRSGVLGRTYCTYRRTNGKLGRRWSTTTIVSRLPPAVDPDRLLRETLAHEYFHGVQCRIAPRLDLLPASIVEGTANWMAAAVTADWARPEGPFLGSLPGLLLRSAASTRSVTRQGYDAWGFWFEATQGRARASRIRTLFRRSANRTRRTNGEADLRAVVPALEQTLLRYALALRGARPLGGTVLPAVYGSTVRDPLPLLDLVERTTASTTVRVEPIAYRFPGVAWDEGSGRITIRVVGVPSAAVGITGQSCGARIRAARSASKTTSGLTDSATTTTSVPSRPARSTACCSIRATRSSNAVVDDARASSQPTTLLGMALVPLGSTDTRPKVARSPASQACLFAASTVIA